MEISAEKKSITTVESDVIIVNLFEGVKCPAGVTGIIDNALNNAVTEFVVSKNNFEGKFGDIFELPVPSIERTIYIAGLGKQSEFTYKKIRDLNAKIVRKINSKNREVNVASILHGAGIGGFDAEKCAEMITCGALSGDYSFDKYKTVKPKHNIKKFVICEIDDIKYQAACKGVERGKIVAEALNNARDLINESAQYLYPETLAKYAAENSGVTTTVYDLQQIKELNMNAFLAVGQGSIHEPRLIHMEYKPENPRKKIALVGKGITFDAGGLDLKPPSSMLTMRDDMSGAASVIAVMQAVSKIKPDVEVHAIIAACENMPSGKAYKPGDVITSKTGRTIEIDNTDAEGRVTLADALAFAEEIGVDEIVDIATLTGACMVALGSVASGIMGNNDEKIRKFIETAEGAGEKFWQMPMFEEYGELLKSDIADTKNTGGRNGGTSAAAIFLSHFVKSTPWIHLDIAGTAFADKPTSEGVKGATGVGIRSLINYVLS